MFRLRKDIFVVNTTISSALKINYRAQRECAVAKIVTCLALQTSKPMDVVALNYVIGLGRWLSLEVLTAQTWGCEFRYPDPIKSQVQYTPL